jgi:hypothetical protein
MKPHIAGVTLLCVDCLDADRAAVAIERTLRQCSFESVKLLTSLPTQSPHRVEIPRIASINDYSAFCMKRLHEYFDTSHCLVVQHDGYVLNGAAWDQSWLAYDYIGPLFEQERPPGPCSVGSGGFSLRSKTLCTMVAGLCPAWDGSNSYDGRDGRNNWGHEDGGICHHYRYDLMHRGCQFAPVNVAVKFAFGRNYDPVSTQHAGTSFGFHGYCPETEARGTDSYRMLAAAHRLKSLPATTTPAEWDHVLEPFLPEWAEHPLHPRP